MLNAIPTTEDERLFDACMERAWHTWEEQWRDRQAELEQEWRKAVAETPDAGPPTLVLAFDADEAGEHAFEEAFLNMSGMTHTEKMFIRSYIFKREEYAHAIAYLSNEELFAEYRDKGRWEKWLREHKETLDPPTRQAWLEMTMEDKAACLQLISNRSAEASAYGKRGGKGPAEEFNEEHTVTAVLSMFGISAAPGRNIPCPAHDDSSPSLTIMRHDRRVFCHNPSCVLYGNGHGEGAYGLYRALSETVERGARADRP